MLIVGKLFDIHAGEQGKKQSVICMLVFERTLFTKLRMSTVDLEDNMEAEKLIKTKNYLIIFNNLRI